MPRLPVLLCLPLVSLPLMAQQPQPPQLAVLALTHVTVIDMTGAPPRPDSTVVITGKTITRLGATRRVRIPRGAQVVDASGKFLIPGLWDMHVHFTETGRTFPLFVANGVLGVRNMGGDPDALFRWRDEVARGRLLGPRLVACGPILDGPQVSAHGPAQAIATPAEGRQAVADLKRRGADCIKVYDGLPREAYVAIVDEAKRQGLPFAGHVPLSISTMEASDAGQSSIEHLGTILEGCSTMEAELRRLESAPPPTGDPSEFPRRIAARGERMLETYDAEKARQLFAHLARNRTWQVPTLVVKRAQAMIDDISRSGDERLKYIPQSEQEWWSPGKNFFSRYRTPEYIVFKRKLFDKEMELVGAMHRAGVPFLSGTDVSGAYVFAGFSLHDELALLVQAGFTPMDALQTATRNPAEFLGELDARGTIARGKAADLVVLGANPLENISNTQRIDAVILQGRYLPKEALERMLGDVEAAASKRPE